jgi:hypothetical protein
MREGYESSFIFGQQVFEKIQTGAVGQFWPLCTRAHKASAKQGACELLCMDEINLLMVLWFLRMPTY